MNFIYPIFFFIPKKGKAKNTVNNYFVDTWQEKELLRMAFSRYWKPKELNLPTIQESGEAQKDDLLSLVRTAVSKSDSKQIELLLHKALRDEHADFDFFETIVEYYQAQPDSLKYGDLSAPYIQVLDKMIERRYNDGKYLMGRADYYKKYEDYDAAREDYNKLIDIYPDDLWFPYVISSTYRKQDMKDEAKVYMRYIKKHAPEIRKKLLNRIGYGENSEIIDSVLESNNQISTLVTDMLKIKPLIKIDR